MIRNYNGKVNHTVIWNLKKLCNVNAVNEKNLFAAFEQNGEVSVYENLCPFTGCPDEMSTTVTLKSEEEIREYLKKDFQERVDGYLSYTKPDDDYFLNALIETIKENGRFPKKEKIRELEKEAEEKRTGGVLPNEVDTKKGITAEDIALEILELAEEILETRRENNSKDIFIPDEPYAERTWVETDEFQGNILHENYYGYEDFRDYRLAIKIKGYHEVEKIAICYCSDGTPVIQAQDWLEQELDDIPVTEYLVSIHKGIVEIAKQEGIEFETEIDYQKVSA